MRRKVKESYTPEVGIFFVIDGILYDWGDPIDEIQAYGQYKNSDLGHYEYFDDLKSIFKDKLSKYDDYMQFPRGRIVYDTTNNIFFVYADTCILKDSSMKAKIEGQFKLSRGRIEWRSDEHYVCPGCDARVASMYEKLGKL